MTALPPNATAETNRSLTKSQLSPPARPHREGVVLGLDGGGTKTVCAALSLPALGDAVLSAGEVMGWGRSGSSNRNSVGDETARRHIYLAIDAALADANARADEVAAICLCLSGIDRPADIALVEWWTRDRLPHAQISIYNDSVAALASGTGGKLHGIVAVSGTGMIVLGYNERGERQRAAGWGALLDRHGSGHALGLGALHAITRAVDGSGPATALTEAVLSHLELATPQQLIPWLYGDLAWSRVAALAPLVFACAEAGDGVADSLLDEAADRLAESVAAVASRLNMANEQFTLVLSGGNLRPGPLQERLRAQIGKVTPGAEIVRPEVEPAVGAAWLAATSRQT